MRRPWQHLYRTARWRAERVEFLSAHPFCAYSGCTELATVVDHIKPHKGDEALFWDRSNWAPICKTCHDGAKQSQERTGRVRGTDASGTPIDPNHHWNRREG